MGKRLESTPRSRVRQALRRLWLRSRERAQALKHGKYTCSICGKKQSRAKGKEVYLEVHHKYGVEWDLVINLIFKYLLIHPSALEVLCEDCHKEEHSKLPF